MTVGDLHDGDRFQLAGDARVHTCAVVMWGTVSVYLTADRGPDSLCVRLPAEQTDVITKLIVREETHALAG